VASGALERVTGLVAWVGAARSGVSTLDALACSVLAAFVVRWTWPARAR
jgi:hypothetical protein